MGADSHERVSHAGVVLAVLPALLVLYLLSIGPVGRAVRDHDELRDSIKTVYLPVIWLHDHTPLKQPLEWYAELWGWK